MLTKIKNKIYSLLRWSEKYTKTDMVYLANGGFWLSFGQLILSLSSFLLAIAFANLLPKEIYGNYKYILSITAIISIFSLSGINTAIIQAINKEKSIDYKQIIKEKLKYGLIGSLISIGIGIYYLMSNNYDFAVAFFFIAILLPMSEAFTVYSAILNGKQAFKKLITINSFIKIVHTILTFILLLITKNLIYLVISYFVFYLILRLYAYKTSVKNSKNEKENTNKEIKKYGLQLSLVDVINTFSSQIDKILIYQILGANTLAIYFMATAPVDQIKQIFKNVLPLTLPKFSQRTAIEIDKILNKKLFIVFFLGLVITICYVIAAPFLFKIFLKQYLESIPYTIYLASLIFLQAVSTVLASVLRSQKLIKIIHQNNITQNVIMILLMIILGLYYGIIGVILAKILSLLSSIILRFILWKRYIKNNT